MTIAQGVQCVNVSGERQFIISHEQKEKMHEAERVELVQTSDVPEELHKKEQQASTEQRPVVILERHKIWSEEQGKPKKLCGKKKSKEKQKKYVNGHRLFEEGHRTEGKNTDGRFDHLLILAHSVELLLESEDDFHRLEMNNQSHEDQIYKDNALDATQGNAKVVAENNASLLQVRTRLTQIRRQARMGNYLVVQEIKGKQTHEYAGIKGFEDKLLDLSGGPNGTGNRETFAADQIQVAMDHQDTGAQPAFKQTHYSRKKVHVPNGLHQLSVQHQSEITNEPKQLAEQYAACQLNLLKTTDKQMDPSAKQYPSTSQGEQAHSLTRDQVGQISMIEPCHLEQLSEMQKNHRFIACQRRLLRALKRRRHLSEKHCGAAKIKGSEKPKTHSSIAWEQQMMSTPEQRICQRQKHHGAAQKEGHLMANGKTNQIYGAEQHLMWHMANVQNGQLQEASQQLQLHVSDLQRQQQQCIAVQQISKHIEEQSLSQNMHAEQEMHSNMNQTFQWPTFTKFCKDQCTEPQFHEQVNTNAEVEEKTSCPRRQIRLSQLKKEARS